MLNFAFSSEVLERITLVDRPQTANPKTEHLVVMFDNGFGISIIRGEFTYGSEDDLFEAAVVRGENQAFSGSFRLIRYQSVQIVPSGCSIVLIQSSEASRLSGQLRRAASYVAVATTRGRRQRRHTIHPTSAIAPSDTNTGRKLLRTNCRYADLSCLCSSSASRLRIIAGARAK